MAKAELRAVITADSRKFLKEMNKVKSTVFAVGKVLSVLAVAGAGGAAYSLVKAMEVEVLQTRLATLLGSMDAAKGKMAELSQFAAETPYALNDLVDMFIRLSGAGFTIDKDSLTALGDLAAASGKSLDELANGMLSAGRGQANMVDNFIGLSAKSEKGGLTMTNALTDITVSGVTSKKAIQDFFVAAGKGDKVAGGMARLSRTGSGMLSTLADNANMAAAAFGEGLLPTLKDGTGKLSDALVRLTAAGNLQLVGAQVGEAVRQLLGMQDGAAAVDQINASLVDLTATLKQMNKDGTFTTINDGLKLVADTAKVLYESVAGLNMVASSFVGKPLGEAWSNLGALQIAKLGANPGTSNAQVNATGIANMTTDTWGGRYAVGVASAANVPIELWARIAKATEFLAEKVR